MREKRICKRHGLVDHIVRSDGGGRRCLECRKMYVVEARRRNKARIVDEHGASCYKCGYDRYIGALDFHHVHPEEKSFSFSDKGLTLGIDKMRKEAAKCVLLCSNCHREIEGGIFSISNEEFENYKQARHIPP